jgi:hypothetical protein
MGEKVHITDTQYENDFAQTCVRERVKNQRGKGAVGMSWPRCHGHERCDQEAVATVFFYLFVLFDDTASARVPTRIFLEDLPPLLRTWQWCHPQMLNNIVRASRRTTRHTAAESTSCLASSASGVEPQAPRLNVWVEEGTGKHENARQLTRLHVFSGRPLKAGRLINFVGGVGLRNIRRCHTPRAREEANEPRLPHLSFRVAADTPKLGDCEEDRTDEAYGGSSAILRGGVVHGLIAAEDRGAREGNVAEEGCNRHHQRREHPRVVLRDQTLRVLLQHRGGDGDPQQQ